MRNSEQYSQPVYSLKGYPYYEDESDQIHQAKMETMAKEIEGSETFAAFWNKVKHVCEHDEAIMFWEEHWKQ